MFDHCFEDIYILQMIGGIVIFVLLVILSIIFGSTKIALIVLGILYWGIFILMILVSMVGYIKRKLKC